MSTDAKVHVAGYLDRNETVVTTEDHERIVGELRKVITRLTHQQVTRLLPDELNTEHRQREAADGFILTGINENVLAGADYAELWERAVAIACAYCEGWEAGDVADLTRRLKYAMLAMGLCVRFIPVERTARLMRGNDEYWAKMMAEHEAVHELVQDLWLRSRLGTDLNDAAPDLEQFENVVSIFQENCREEPA